MNIADCIKKKTLSELLDEYPYALDFFEQNRLEVLENQNLTFKDYLLSLDEQLVEEEAIDVNALPKELELYIEQMIEFLGIEKQNGVSSLSI